MFYKNGVEMHKMIGAKNEYDIRNKIEEILEMNLDQEDQPEE